MSPAASAQTVQLVWSVSLVLGIVVTVVVAVLLHLLLKTTRRILAAAADIWTDGQRVANNTVQIAMLDRTNQLFAGILTEAVLLAGDTKHVAEATRRTGGAGQ